MERKRILIYPLPSFLFLLPVFLYAETHYRFRYFFSFLRKNEPEIIADAPHRIEPNSPLPLLILVKDSDLFPITLNNISVNVNLNNKRILQRNILDAPVKIADKLWWRVFEFPLNGLNGTIECDVQFEITDGKQSRIYKNDNNRTSSNRPLNIFISPAPLPRFKNLHFGECHSHSSFSSDQVEFGSPLAASSQLGRSLGLSFFCATDHSYDLDDMTDNYLINDPGISKWHAFQEEVTELNSNIKDFIIVRGEEISCRNSTDKNVHLLLLGNKKFYPGSGDSAEKWFKTRSELSIDDVLNDAELSIPSFAAHPKDSISFLQKRLLGRGNWSDNDLLNSRLTGIQFVNGVLSKSFWLGYKQWIKILLNGKRFFILAGNDAHGNFNRFRQIGVPFLKIKESNEQLFGKMRTGVFLESLSENNILDAIRLGNSIVTDGPAINIHVKNSGNVITSIGKDIFGKDHILIFEALSSIEYGSIVSLKLFIGTIDEEEKIFYSETLSSFNINKIFKLTAEKKIYIRAEIWTSSSDSQDGCTHYCLTNPIWFNPN